MRKTLVSSVLVLLTLAAVAGCEKTQFEVNVYRVLATAEAGYHVAYSVMGEAYRNGKIGDDVKEKALRAGNIFYASFQTSAFALREFHKLTAEEQLAATNQEKLLLVVGDMILKHQQLLDLAERAAGHKLEIPELPLFPALSQVLRQMAAKE